MTREWTSSKPSQSKLIVHITVTQVAFKENKLHHAACMTHRSHSYALLNTKMSTCLSLNSIFEDAFHLLVLFSP